MGSHNHSHCHSVLDGFDSMSFDVSSQEFFNSCNCMTSNCYCLVSSFCVCATSSDTHSCSCSSLFRRRDEVSTIREEEEDEELQKDYEVLLQFKAADKPFYLSNVFMPIMEDGDPDLQNIELLAKDITDRPVIRCKWANCEQTFLTVEHLGLHLKNCHVKAQKERENSLKKGFTCEWQGCTSADKRYRDSCNLMIHLRYKHTGERPYACSEPGCDKRFVQEHHMKKHAKAIHLPTAKNNMTVEDVNPPEICGQEIPDLIMEEVRTVSVSNTKKKRKISDTIEDLQTIAPEKLQECGYTANYQCKWKNCNATFIDIEAQSNHIAEAHIKIQKLLNRKEKKRGFACEWTGCTREKPFNSCYNLEHHIRYKHTGEKPYACTVTGCFSRFAQASDLREHLRLHSNPVHPEEAFKKMRMSPEDELTERFLQNAQSDNLLLPPISRLLLPLH